MIQHVRTLAPLAALLFAAAACNSDDHVSGTRTATADDARPAAADKPAAKAEVGQPAPDFTLVDLDGKKHSLAQYKGKVVVLEWFSPGCPMTKWAYDESGPFATLPAKLEKDGVVWLAINSEGPENKAASAKANKDFVEEYGMKAPILLDPTGSVGKSFGAKTTPHVYVVDAKGKLVYMGGIDNAPQGRVKGGGDKVDYLQNAVSDVKAGRAVKTPETQAYG